MYPIGESISNLLKEIAQMGIQIIHLSSKVLRVPCGSVVRCLTRNSGVLGSSHTGSSGIFRGSVLRQDTSEFRLVLVKPHSINQSIKSSVRHPEHDQGLKCEFINKSLTKAKCWTCSNQKHLQRN